MRNSKKISINNLQTAIVHDTLITDGGAERVLFAFSEIFPSADIFTSLLDPNNPQFKKLFRRIKLYWKNIPIINNSVNFLKPLINLYWESLELSKYQLVISSSHSFSSKAILTRPETLHICYCHTPPRFLYPELSESDIDSSILNPAKRILFSKMRNYDFITAQRPDLFIANSNQVKQRIKKYYRRSSKVIYPPVSIPRTAPKRKEIQDYYLCISRLSKVKNVNLLIDAFNLTNKRLIIVGEGKEFNKLAKLKAPNITLTGFIAEKEKNNYLKHAKAFIFPAIDEDFGIAPVEAMAHGVPVIAFYSGGVKESVVQGKTGIFFRENTPQALAKAIKKFKTPNFNPLDCYKQATKFSQERFEREVKSFVQKAWKSKSL